MLPRALKPVMEVCIPDDVQSFMIKNRGIDSAPVNWTIIPEGPGCLADTEAPACLADSPSCLVLRPSQGRTSTDSPSTVTYAVNSVESHPIDLDISSEEGDICVRIVPSVSAGKHHMIAFRESLRP